MIDLPELERHLRSALAGPLPGAAAQMCFAPRPPRAGWRPSVLPEDARSAAGLLLIYPDDEIRALLTVRPATLARHGGQVSLPGGAIEPGETVEEAALREAAEEVGLGPEGVRTLGKLTPLHIPVSGFALHPVVGVCDTRPRLTLTREVERILEVPLTEISDPACVGRGSRLREDQHVEFPYFALRGGEQVWGATAMVLAEFLWLLGVRLDPWKD